MRTWEWKLERILIHLWGIPLADISGVPRQRRQQHIQHLQDQAAKPKFMSDAYIHARQRMLNPPKAPPTGPWPKPKAIEANNQIARRLVLESTPQYRTESVSSRPSAPSTGTVDTADWEHDMMQSESDREDICAHIFATETARIRERSKSRDDGVWY